MTRTAQLPEFARVQLDRRALALVGLFTVVIGLSLALVNTPAGPQTPSAASGMSTTEQATTGAVWAIAEAAFAGVLLGAVLLWRRFPEWLQEALMDAAKFGVAMLIGGVAFAAGVFYAAVPVVVALVVLFKLSDTFDVYWLINDVLAIAVAVYVAVFAGVVLGPVILAVGFAGLSVYDYVFADRSSAMFQLGAWTVRRRLPALFIVPSSWRLDWMALAGAMEGDEDAPEDVIRFGIGMADLALPAAFAVALAHNGGGLPLVGAVAGILLACARVSAKMQTGGGAGLPPLASGALGGWALALGVGVVA